MTQSPDVRFVTESTLGARSADLVNSTVGPLRSALDTRYGGKVAKGELVVNVKDYGAVGDGTADDFAAVRDALAATPAGGTLYFPPGKYWTAYRDPSIETNQIVITKNGVTLAASPGSVTLENFLIYIKGTYGPLLDIAANTTRGGTGLTTTTVHGAVAGEYLQMLSAINSYTPDGGAWALGSSSPTDSSQPITRYAEIHRIKTVDTTTAVTFNDLVTYPGYNTSTAGQTYPISGVTRAQTRKLAPVQNITFHGIGFKNTNNNSFRCVTVRACVGLTFNECTFTSGALSGALVKVSDSLNTRFLGCKSFRDLGTFSGSSWNTFLIGGGCHGTLFDGCEFVGEAQAIDFTPNTFLTSTADIGGPTDIAAAWLTNQFMRVTNSTFRNCSDATTSHPGTYLFEFSNNTVAGGSTGVRARSKSSIIRGNTIYTSRAGVSLSAFISDSIVSGNQFIQSAATTYAAWWEGIGYYATSSEIMSDNAPKNVRIINNTFKAAVAYATNAGVRLMHTTPTGYTPFTDDIKNNLSDISVSDNTFIGCSMIVAQWVNGTLISNNTFRGGSDQTYYILCQAESAANNIYSNYFRDNTVGHIQTSAVTLTGHGYSTAHRVGLQRSDGPSLLSITNAIANVVSGSGVLFDTLGMGNAGTLSATRDAGSATLNLDATPTDGTSTSTVSVFANNTSTGAKTLKVAGVSEGTSFRLGSTGPSWSVGSGTPEAVVTAPIGSLYSNTAGGATTTLYMKTAGAGNTGWTAVT